jgi:hypothetical protein
MPVVDPAGNRQEPAETRRNRQGPGRNRPEQGETVQEPAGTGRTGQDPAGTGPEPAVDHGQKLSWIVYGAPSEWLTHRLRSPCR